MFLDPGQAVSRQLAAFDGGARRWFTHDELRNEASVFARELAQFRGGLAFLFCRNTVGAVAAYLGCVEAGCAVALLDAKANAQLHGDLLSRYRPDVLLCPDGLPVLEGFRAGVTRLSITIARRASAETNAPVNPDLAVLLSTSGSTGSPKLVRLTRRNVEANAGSIREALAIDAPERGMAYLPIHYSYGLSIVNSHLTAGASVVLTDESVIAPDFWELFREQQCTSMPGVPYTYQMLARIGFEKLELPSLRTLTQAGGKLGEDLIRRFHADMDRRQGRFYVMYGQTEATARIACLPWDRLPEKLGSAGLAIPRGRLSVDPGDGTIVGPKVSGEIVYTGPNVMMGYASTREDLARGDELQGVLHTGDLGYLDPDGFLFVTGRSKRIGKVFGIRVNLEEVEARLRSHGPTAVLAGDDRLIIFCEYGDAQQFAALAHELAAEMRVHHSAFEFRRVEALPLNANGKIDYQRLSQA